MKQDRGQNGLARTAACLVAACMIGSVVHAQSSPEPDGTDIGPRLKPNETRPALPDGDMLASRLRERLEDMDALRERIASMIDQLESGADPGELLEPEDRRWLGVGLGNGRAIRGDGLGDAEPRGLPDRFDRGPGRRSGPMAGEPGEGRSGGPPPGGPHDGSFDRDGSRMRGPELSSDQLDEIRAIIDEHIPMLAVRLQAAEAKDPEAAARFCERIAPRFRDILELRERAPELVEVRIDEIRTGMAIVAASRDLRRLHESEPGGTAFIAKKDEIRGLLVRQFELRQTLELDRITRQIAELEAERARIEARTGQSEETIDGHLARVLERTLRSENDHPGNTNGRGAGRRAGDREPPRD